MSFQSLKFKIAGNIAVIVFISVLFSDLIIISLIQKSLIRDRIAKGKVLLAAMPTPLDADAILQMRGGQLIEKIYSLPILFFRIRLEGDQDYQFGKPAAELHSWIKKFETLTFLEGKEQVEFFGKTIGVFGPQKKYLMISSPIFDSTRNKTGTKLAVFPLNDIFEVLQESQKPIFFYGVANFAVLVLFGVYRLSQLVIRPLHRFIKMTDDYREKDRLYFTHGKNYQEFNQLSKALNHMLDLIESDKQNLRHSLEELEKANSELKTAQNEIVKAEKLASVGRLSAGIAHEIGNPISILLGYLDLLDTRPALQKDDAARDYVKRMQNEVNRIHRIIRQLLDFSRSMPEESRVVSVHALVRDIVAMMSVQPLLQNVILDFQPGATFDGVLIDRDKMRQVLINLIINAADSIHGPKGRQNGEIHILTELLPGNESLSLNGSETFLLKIMDNGCGIAENDLNSIFDPFYTTKPPGKGTGLGLTVSYMIIEQAGGRVNVASKIGEGTCILIYLPLFKKGKPESAESTITSETV